MKKRLLALVMVLLMLLTSGCSLLNKIKEPEQENDLAQKLAQAMAQQAGEKEPQGEEKPEKAQPELPADPMLWTTETEHLADCRMPEVTYGENEGDVRIAWNLDGMVLMNVSRARVTDALAADFAEAKAAQDARYAKEAENWPGFEYYHIEAEVDDYGTPCMYTGVGLMNADWVFKFEAKVEIEDGEAYIELVSRMVKALYVDDLNTVLALAQSTYEGGAQGGSESLGSEDIDFEVYYEYAELLNDIWVAENYADEKAPHIWAFCEDGTVLFSYEDYYAYPEHDGSSSEWGLTDDAGLKEAYMASCDPDSAYVPVSGTQDVLYILNPRGTADGGAYALPMQLHYLQDTLTVYWGYDEVQTFYRVGSERASKLLRGTVYDGELPVRHYAYMRIDEVNEDGSFIAAMEDVLFLGWEDEDLMREYGIDPEEVTNDYAIVQINEGQETLIPVHPAAELSIIDWYWEYSDEDADIVSGMPADRDLFCEHLMKRYEEYGTRAFVAYIQMRGEINYISEVYLP